MKVKIVTITLLLCTAMVGYSNLSFAEICYNAGGTVSTENVTSTLQLGSISLSLSDDGDATVFSETGSLAGNITGTDGFGTTLLSHRAKFPQGNMFVTKADKAVLVLPVVRKTLEDGMTPCSFWIHETISNISVGTRFFSNVTSVEIKADGYISNCPDENENHFDLSGEVCVE